MPENFPSVRGHLAILLVVRGCQARALWALWTFEAQVLLAGMWWFEPLLAELSSFYAVQTTTIARL